MMCYPRTPWILHSQVFEVLFVAVSAFVCEASNVSTVFALEDTLATFFAFICLPNE